MIECHTCGEPLAPETIGRHTTEAVGPYGPDAPIEIEERWYCFAHAAVVRPRPRARDSFAGPASHVPAGTIHDRSPLMAGEAWETLAAEAYYIAALGSSRVGGILMGIDLHIAEPAVAVEFVRLVEERTSPEKMAMYRALRDVMRSTREAMR